MRKIYHTPQEKREAERTRDRKRNHTEHRHAYDRKRHNTDEVRAKRRARAALRREEKKRNPPMPKSATQLTFFKICPKCATEKHLSEFPLSKNCKDGHNGYCNECIKKWAQSDKGRAWERERGRKRRLDPEFLKIARQRKRAWDDKHPLAVRAYVLKRYARKKRASTIEKVDFASILERDGLFCYICEQAILPDQAIDFDHVIPLSRGGVHTESNLKPTHHLCNRRKFNKLLEELTPHDRRGVA